MINLVFWSVLLAPIYGLWAAAFHWIWITYFFYHMFSHRPHGIMMLFMIIFCPIMLLGFSLFLIYFCSQKLIRSLKCRNSHLATWMGLFTGFTSSAIYIIISLKIPHTLELGLPYRVDMGWFAIFMLVVNSLLMIGESGFEPHNMLTTHPFCEHCQDWYTDLSTLRIPTTNVHFFLLALENLDVTILQCIQRARQFPNIEVHLKGCTTCNQSDYYLEAKLHWLEQNRLQDKQGNITVHHKPTSSPWFNTMVSRIFGDTLLKMV